MKKIKQFEKLIKPFGKHRYIIASIIIIIPILFMIFNAIYNQNVFSAAVAFFCMFWVGYCWEQDTERIKEQNQEY